MRVAQYSVVPDVVVQFTILHFNAEYLVCVVTAGEGGHQGCFQACRREEGRIYLLPVMPLPRLLCDSIPDSLRVERVQGQAGRQDGRDGRGQAEGQAAGRGGGGYIAL